MKRMVLVWAMMAGLVGGSSGQAWRKTTLDPQTQIVEVELLKAVSHLVFDVRTVTLPEVKFQLRAVSPRPPVGSAALPAMRKLEGKMLVVELPYVHSGHGIAEGSTVQVSWEAVRINGKSIYAGVVGK
jgi:hypothetical protein